MKTKKASLEGDSMVTFSSVYQEMERHAVKEQYNPTFTEKIAGVMKKTLLPGLKEKNADVEGPSLPKRTKKTPASQKKLKILL